MRRLLESLMPDGRQIYWTWVGGMFALYVVLMGTAASVFVNHESTRKLAQEPATTVATDRSITPVSTTLRQAARLGPISVLQKGRRARQRCRLRASPWCLRSSLA